MRRELWENRSIYFASFAVAAIIVNATLIAAIVVFLGRGAVVPHKTEHSYDFAAVLLMGTMFIVAVF